MHTLKKKNAHPFKPRTNTPLVRNYTTLWGKNGAHNSGVIRVPQPRHKLQPAVAPPQTGQCTPGWLQYERKIKRARTANTWRHRISLTCLVTVT